MPVLLFKDTSDAINYIHTKYEYSGAVFDSLYFQYYEF